MKNELYYGDNLDVLRRKVGSESVDLCYIDPPFNSKRNYFQIYNNQGSEDRAQAQAFVDTWNWGDEAIEGRKSASNCKPATTSQQLTDGISSLYPNT